MNAPEPPAVPPLYWDGCQFYADAGKGTHYVDAPYEGRYAVMFLTSSGHWAHQGNVDELPEAFMRLNLPTDIAAGAVPDTVHRVVYETEADDCEWSDTGKHVRGSGRDRDECRHCDHYLAAASPSGDTVQAPESSTDSTPKAGRWGSSEAETATGAVQAPDVASRVDTELMLLARAVEKMAGYDNDVQVPWVVERIGLIRALLGTDTTPDRLAWISEAGEIAAVERQARYQETACARRPAEPSGDPAPPDLAYARSEVDKWLADGDPYCILPTRTEHIPALLARLDELEGTS